MKENVIDISHDSDTEGELSVVGELNEERWKDADFLSFNDEGGTNGKKDEWSGGRYVSERIGYPADGNLNGSEKAPPWTMLRQASSTSNRLVPPLIALHNEIVDFVSLIEPQPDEIEIRDALVAEVTEIAVQTFGGSEKVCCRTAVEYLPCLSPSGHLAVYCTMCQRLNNF